MLEMIGARRRELGLSLETVGGWIGLDKSQYSRIERGEAGLTLDRAMVLFDKLNMDVKIGGNPLPQQKAPSPVPVEEIIKLSSRVVSLQEETLSLNHRIEVLMEENNELKMKDVLRRNTSIFNFFELQVSRMKQSYPEYKPDWVGIAAAAKLPNAELFLHQFGEYQANHVNDFFSGENVVNQDHEQDASMSEHELAERVKNLAMAAGMTPYDFLNQELQKRQPEFQKPADQSVPAPKKKP